MIIEPRFRLPMNILRQLFGQKNTAETPKHEKMTEAKVDFSFRIYWTKIGRAWDLEHIHTLQTEVKAVTNEVDFQKNLIDRRYVVPSLDEQAHSGASLLALLDVLAALAKSKQSEGDS